MPHDNLKKLGITAKELDMAEKLVSGMVEKWHPERYRDGCRSDLLALSHARAKAGETNTVSHDPVKVTRSKQPTKVVDLVALLAQSMESGQQRKLRAHQPRSARVKAGARKRASNKALTGPVTQHRKSA